MLTEEQLREAENILRKRKCQREGHDYEVRMKGMLGIPEGVQCVNCGDFWRVFKPVDPPTMVVKTIDAPTHVMPRQT